MKVKTLAITVTTAAILSACSNIQTAKHTATTVSTPTVTAPVGPITFKEPELPQPFYVLNAVNYDKPSDFEINLQKAAAQPVTKMIATNPKDPSQTQTFDENHLIIPAIDNTKNTIKFSPLAGQNELDVTAIDDFLQLVEGQARHYPPKFTNKMVRRGFESKLKQTTQFLDGYASKDNASYDVLFRAFKASIMARNLDLGSQYTTQSLKYGQRLLKMAPNDPLVNFWFGFNLSEGGGQREAIPYLDKAVKAGVQEAYLSAANNYLYLEQNRNAITTLRNYKVKYPQEAQVADQLIKEIQTQGRTNVWENLNNMKKGSY
ncbi:hypothetical protein I2F27_07320 [Acinetobacter sp. B5B]|uniref:ABUW_2363 family tetratricopeptide repeat lipoprotein n=1 Tax=Acinetobacter baretiae TaxID=2605383 RepID=UPI0018C2AD07|nr:hypothetical protein [Acinetobacter baretiae]MBF7683135.1 hypothetical protein [Acinetobacter baretiae]MBF7684529.1 hypothetical protein [Acinetobacter baretiae]